jgi:hypothetical protein
MPTGVRMSYGTAAWLAISLAAWMANAALHLEFSNWIVASYNTPFGLFVPRDHTLTIATLVSLFMATIIARQWWHGVKPVLSISAWCLIFTIMISSMKLITTTNVEMIHFLQYGLLTCLLAQAFDAKRENWPLLPLMFLVIFLGILDELNQYFYLTPNNSSYIDFNDFVLNQIGACAGLLAWYGFRQAPATRPVWGMLHTVILGAYILLLLAVLALCLTGYLRYTPKGTVPPGGIDIINGNPVIFFQREPGLLSSSIPTFTSGEYYVMGALEGFFVMLAITSLLAVFVKLSQMPSR